MCKFRESEDGVEPFVPIANPEGRRIVFAQIRLLLECDCQFVRRRSNPFWKQNWVAERPAIVFTFGVGGGQVDVFFGLDKVPERRRSQSFCDPRVTGRQEAVKIAAERITSTESEQHRSTNVGRAQGKTESRRFVGFLSFSHPIVSAGE